MKKYYKDYKLVHRLQKNGRTKQEAEYTGKYYVCRLNKTDFIKKKLCYFALAICSDATVIGIGILNTSGSRVYYVALPYVFLFLPAVFCLMGVIGFTAAKDKLEYAAYDKTRNRIHRSTIGQLFISSFVVLGDICYLLFGKNVEDLPREILFLCGIGIVFVLNSLFLRIQKKVIYEVEEPDI